MVNPTLPPELLNMIMPLAVPSPSRASLRERTAMLASLARVSRTWHVYAQPQLYTHLRLTDKRLRALSAELKRKNAPSDKRSAARRVEVVSLGKWVDGYGAGLKTTLSEFTNVKEAYLEGTKEFGSLTAVATFPKLETLHLTRVYNFTPSPHGFPLLRRLSLAFGLDNGIKWEFLLKPSILPSLSTLILEPADWTFAQDPCFLSCFATVAPKLESLLLAGMDHGGVDFAQLLRKASNLKHLYIHTTSSNNLLAAVPSLPAALETLRLSSSAASPETVAAVLTQEQEVPHSLASLKRLSLPKSTANGWDFATEESVKAKQAIEEWCARRGVQLEIIAKHGMQLEDWVPAPVVVEQRDW